VVIIIWPNRSFLKHCWPLLTFSDSLTLAKTSHNSWLSNGIINPTL
jgi:hypothetical protein